MEKYNYIYKRPGNSKKEADRPPAINCSNKMEVIRYRYACLRTHVVVSRVDRTFLGNFNFFNVHWESALYDKVRLFL